jgi:hypothetical protein
MPFVYALVCEKSGFAYVGVTRCVNKRMADHRWQLNRGIHHCRAMLADWRRFGPDAFRMIVLETVPAGQSRDLDSAERRWHRLFAIQGRLYSKGMSGADALQVDDVERCVSAMERVTRPVTVSPEEMAVISRHLMT